MSAQTLGGEEERCSCQASQAWSCCGVSMGLDRWIGVHRAQRKEGRSDRGKC